MEKRKAHFKNAYPYQQDKMNLPVANVEAAVNYYISVMGFALISKAEEPYPSVVLGRDEVQIGLSENGGDPEQDGCFFEVDYVDTAFAELQANGLGAEKASFDIQQHGSTKWKVFFVIAPDKLCYCIGERQI